MTRDRLQELLRRVEAEKAAANGDAVIYLGGDFYNDVFEDDEEEDKFSAVLDKIETIWTLVNQLTENITGMKLLHTDILNSAWTDERVTATLEEKNRDIQLTITTALHKLKELTKRAQQEEEEAGDYEPTLCRILRIQCGSLKRCIRDAIVEYNTTLIRHQERCAELVRQQMRIARRSVTEEEFLQENQNEDKNPFTENILMETLAARQDLDDLHTRQKELQEVENSLVELRNMFVNIASMIEDQGHFIDNIEKEVTSTKDYVMKAKTKVENAKMLKKKYRKRKWCLIGTLVAILLIVLIILLIIYVPQSSSSSSTPTTTTNTP